MTALDLHQVYGIDDLDLFARNDRPWRWAITRILGLLDLPETRLRAVIDGLTKQ
ncbi:hypothetical protein [Mycetocola reblochoni]|uniref:hypothetical protein n=1 Tax=Mycetocola reblochoni TaxID=331618 RepID=UPI001C4F2AC1|nr:hypothetical protein [Mycetocola reblochoni]